MQESAQPILPFTSMEDSGNPVRRGSQQIALGAIEEASPILCPFDDIYGIPFQRTLCHHMMLKYKNVVGVRSELVISIVAVVLMQGISKKPVTLSTFL